MNINFAIVGFLGRMGKEIACLSEEYPSVNFSMGIETAGKIQQDNITIKNKEIPLKSLLELSKTDIENIQGVIDFSHKEATLQSVSLFAQYKKPIVIGTTGFTDSSELQTIGTKAQQIPILMSANMSLGVNLLFQLTKKASSVLKNKNFEAEIIEIHHKHKKDSPSGTARKLEDIISSHMEIPKENVTHGREGMVGERKPKELGSFAIRGGDTPGDHTIYFLGEGERIELKHQAISRSIFARGAIEALIWLHNQPPGLYSMDDILNDLMQL